MQSSNTSIGGDDKIKILELDFLHLHEGECNKMMRFGENQSSLAQKQDPPLAQKLVGKSPKKQRGVHDKNNHMSS